MTASPPSCDNQNCPRTSPPAEPARSLDPPAPKREFSAPDMEEAPRAGLLQTPVHGDGRPRASWSPGPPPGPAVCVHGHTTHCAPPVTQILTTGKSKRGPRGFIKTNSYTPQRVAFSARPKFLLLAHAQPVLGCWLLSRWPVYFNMNDLSMVCGFHPTQTVKPGRLKNESFLHN